MNIEDLMKLVIQKEETITTSEEQEKINALKELFQNPTCFFSMKMEVAVDILLFLGISEEQVIDIYFALCSPTSFQKIPKTREITSHKK